MYDVKRILPLLQERSHVLYSCRIAFRGGDVVTRRGRACSFEERAVPVLTQALTHTACTNTVKYVLYRSSHRSTLIQYITRHVNETFDFCTKIQ